MPHQRSRISPNNPPSNGGAALPVPPIAMRLLKATFQDRGEKPATFHNRQQWSWFDETGPPEITQILTTKEPVLR